MIRTHNLRRSRVNDYSVSYVLIRGGKMTDESYKKGFNTALKVILGLVLIIVGLVANWAFRSAVATIIMAFLGFAFLLAGVSTLALAKD